MNLKRWLLTAFHLFSFLSCSNRQEDKGPEVPVIGFLDAFEDLSLAKARTGFVQALADSGYSEEKGTLSLIFRNAQNDIPALTQAVDFFVSKQVDLIAANSTLSTITAVRKGQGLPVCMLVAPHPVQAGLSKEGTVPPGLFGVYETLAYIDTSLALIKEVLPDVKRIGILYNQSEPQSNDAFNHLNALCTKLGMTCIGVAVANSSETSLAVQGVLSQKIDAFFAMPDNTVFASFETIQKTCMAARIPVFTSEAGLVERGALCAYGADLFLWGYQAGQSAAAFLKNKGPVPAPEEVRVRKKVVNAKVAKQLGIQYDFKTFEPIGG